MKARWIALESTDPSALLERLELVATGAAYMGHEEWLCAVLPTGWVVVVQHAYEEPEDPKRFIDLGSSVLTGACGTVSMYSQLASQTWSVDYACERNSGDLMLVEGSPPESFDDLLGRARAEAVRDDEVDYVWDVPLQLSDKICGYHPEKELPGGSVTIAVERRLGVAAASAQQEKQRLNRLLERKARAELGPRIAALGFAPVDQFPDHKAHFTDPASTFMRHRGPISEMLRLLWTMHEGEAHLFLQFFAYEGRSLPAGEFGVGYTPQRPPPGFLKRLLGKKDVGGPEDEIDKAVVASIPLLEAVDRHLREGVLHEQIRPARYYEAIS